MVGDGLSISQQVVSNQFLSQHLIPSEFFFNSQFSREGAGNEQVAMWYLVAGWV